MCYYVSSVSGDEYDILKSFRRYRFKWIARNSDGTLYIYKNKPLKNKGLWVEKDGRVDSNYVVDISRYSSMFRMVDRFSNNPTRVRDLIYTYYGLNN